MNYYEIKMDIPGPYVNFPVGEGDGLHPHDRGVAATKEAGQNIRAAETIAKIWFPTIGVKIKHAYSWTDGSLYFFACCKDELTMDDLPKALFGHVEKIRKIKGSDDPSKAYADTVAEYMQQD